MPCNVSLAGRAFAAELESLCKNPTLTYPALLQSGSSFSNSMATLFAPMGAEYNLAAKHPHSETTLANIDTYQQLMEELRGGCSGHVD